MVAKVRLHCLQWSFDLRRPVQAAKANNVIDVSLRRSNFSFLKWLALFPRGRSLQASLVSYMNGACYLDCINTSVTMLLCKRSFCCSLDPCSGSVCDFKVNHLLSWHAICVETAPERSMISCRLTQSRSWSSFKPLHRHFQMLWLWCHVLNSKTSLPCSAACTLQVKCAPFQWFA